MNYDDAHGDFAAVVAEHHATIHRLAYRLLGWRGDCDDVAQEVFLAAWGAWSRYPGPDLAKPWLMRIAVNKCRSRLRREAVRARWLSWFSATGDDERRVAYNDNLEEQETAIAVRRAIQQLEPRYREVVVLHYLEGLDLDAIAEVCSRRRNTVEVQLHRARQMLQPLLEEIAR